MVAIRTLGDLNSEEALPAFRAMLADENDFYTLREILNAVRKIDSEQRAQILKDATEHAFTLIRAHARELLDGMRQDAP